MSFQNQAASGTEHGEEEIEERRFSDTDTADDRTITSLTMEDNDKNIAALPLTGGNGVVVRSYTNSPHYLPLAIITLIVNPLFGPPAVVCACMSRKRKQRGDDAAATRFGKAAFWLSMVGIAISIVFGVFAIVYIYVIIPNIIRINLEEIT